MRWLLLVVLTGNASVWAAGRPEDVEPADPLADAPMRSSGTSPVSGASSPLGMGRRITSQLFGGQTEALWATAGPALRRQLNSLDGLNGFARKVKGDFGVELRVGAETVQERGALTVYTRLSVFSLYARGVELQWTWDGAGLLVSMSARQAVTEAPSPHLHTTAKVTLRLPFEGSWNVLWGGRTWEENRHASVSDQRFALDLLMWKGPGTFEGDGTRNEQYFCWGKPVVVPGDGRVVLVEDGVLDNVPGQVNPTKLYGNHVVIEHGNGEYSLLGHLMRGSILVKPGERVRSGQALGRSGNSGVSTEPHLHYQLMDAPEWLRADGIPVVFVDYLSDGKPMARGEPRRGQVLCPMSASR